MTDTLHIRSDDADAPIAAYPHIDNKKREIVRRMYRAGLQTSELYYGACVVRMAKDLLICGAADNDFVRRYAVVFGVNLDEARRFYP